MAQSYWVNFAKSGDPNGADLPAWPRHGTRKDSIFQFRRDGLAGRHGCPERAAGRHQLATESGKRSDF
jgi:para-nitrobenzyl esterase